MTSVGNARPSFGAAVDDIDMLMERIRRMIATYGEKDPALLEGPAMADLTRVQRRIDAGINAVREAEQVAEHNKAKWEAGEDLNDPKRRTVLGHPITAVRSR